MGPRAVVVTSVVRPGAGRGAMVVEVRHILGQHCREMAAVDDQDPVQHAAGSCDPAFGNRRVRIPSLANAASNMPVNLLSRS